MAESKKSTREKAAQARAAAQAAERRRERTIRIVGGLVVLIVVGAILAVGIVNSRKSPSPTASADANSPRPAGVSEDYGVVVNAGVQAPTLEIYEDYQCPACAALEASMGATIEQAAKDGKVQLTYRPMIFLDENLKTDHSVRAAAAWGCAIDAGKAVEYHNVVYANQPAQEGAGWTDEQLKDFGKQAGIKGADYDTFVACVDSGKYKGWAELSNQAAFERGVTGTPTVYLNGEEMSREDLANPKAFEQAIANAQKQ